MGLDIDQRRIDSLSAGLAPFHEPGLPELLDRNVANGRLRFTTDPALIRDADLHFIGVGTPQLEGELRADMSHVDAALETILTHAGSRQGTPALVVGKSTVPVGTAQRLVERISEADSNLLLAWNPEFLREGHAVEDTLHPDRIV